MLGHSIERLWRGRGKHFAVLSNCHTLSNFKQKNRQLVAAGYNFVSAGMHCSDEGFREGDRRSPLPIFASAELRSGLAFDGTHLDQHLAVNFPLILPV